jgi:hypothetical protein
MNHLFTPAARRQTRRVAAISVGRVHQPAAKSLANKIQGRTGVSASRPTSTPTMMHYPSIPDKDPESLSLEDAAASDPRLSQTLDNMQTGGDATETRMWTLWSEYEIPYPSSSFES